jgi:hypothetical protein
MFNVGCAIGSFDEPVFGLDLADLTRLHQSRKSGAGAHVFPPILI